VLAWVPGNSKVRLAQPFRFTVEHIAKGNTGTVSPDLSWDLAALEQQSPGVGAHALRLREGRSA